MNEVSRHAPSWLRHFRRKRLLIPSTTLVLLLGSLAWPLPRQVTRQAPVHSVRVTDKFGQTLRIVGSDGRFKWVPLGDIDPAIIGALIATEDRSFYLHHGVSVSGIARAVRDNVRAGRVVSGASTITMQVARALRGSDRRRLSDKLLEAHLAVRLELHKPKEAILEEWLNRVSFGNRILGIGEAAEFYFGKSAEDLTLSEATLLVGLPQIPSRYNPLRHFDRALARRETVLRAAEREGVFTNDQVETIRRTVPTLASRQAVDFAAPHFVDAVRRSLGSEWANVVEVRTTVDPQLQHSVEELAKSHLRLVSPLGVSNVAAIVLDNHTGNVLAWLGSADYWDAQSLGQNDGVTALRQPGSSLKPFAYAAAFRRGLLRPESIIPDLPIQVPGAGGAFSPVNYDKKYHGPVSARTALASSYNVPAIRLAQLVTPEKILDDLHDVGFASLQRSARRYGVGLVLGNGEVTLLELARAYSSLARAGSIPDVRTVEWLLTVDGDTLLSPAPTSHQTVIDEGTAFLVTDILSDAEAREPAFGRGGPLELPFPAAAKTGTSKDYRDNVTVGYTPAHTVAVWAGNFDGSPMQRVSGISGAGPLMKAILLEIGSGGSFDVPREMAFATVCEGSGKLPGRFCRNTASRPVSRTQLPSDTCDIHVTIDYDLRTGRRATPDTPPSFRAAREFVALPEIYDEWMVEHGLERPPDSEVDNIALTILYPTDGTRYQIDPILREGWQRIALSAALSSNVTGAQWWIDGRQYQNVSDSVSWPLTAGTHRFELRGRVRDKTLHSQPVTVHVSSVQD